MSAYVVCIDGTWNRPADPDGDPIDIQTETTLETNVRRVAHFLADESRSRQNGIASVAPIWIDPQQQTSGHAGDVFYVPGVGSSGSLLTRGWAGFTGYGTMDRILLAYQFLAERYRQGDRIFGFGFSRGAYAIRSLAGLLHHVGLPVSPRRLDTLELNTVVDSYKRCAGPSALPGFRPTDVDFLGVWDTVGSLWFEPDDSTFHEVSPPNVTRVAHALALDEQRRDFAPTYWTPVGSTKVEEVWFAGVHSNVGGGYDNQQLSNIALAWVLAEAVDAGLPTEGKYIPGWYNENIFRQMNDSHREFLAPLGRLGYLLKRSPQQRAILPAHGVHRSVFDRMGRVTSPYVTSGDLKPVDWEDYLPAALLDGRPLPDKLAAFKGRSPETLDYLSR